MNIATSIRNGARALGAFSTHLAHGALLAMGALSIAGVMAGVLEHQRVSVPLVAALSPAHAAGMADAAPNPVTTHFDLAVADMLADDADTDAGVAALSPALARVKAYVARKYRVSSAALAAPIAQAQQSGKALGIDPLLIVAVMAVESSFNPLAESTVGAQGLMQVIPKFHLDKIGPDAGPEALFDPDTNVRVGALVIKEGLRRYGSMKRALQYYGGALSDPSAGYARKVLAMKARLEKVAEDGAA
ncbi:transglycosylase SLT domain-containing protein [Nitrogeniibacter mangrovi]|nr:transglycosylase SLT domain-containing protein [Nitrogeniibacter mangrovi]